ncbi:CopG family antitoxin [Chloroflexota bacterium]
MVKGRNTMVVTTRLPDDLVAELKKRANKAGIPYTVLMRHYLQEKCGMRMS